MGEALALRAVGRGVLWLSLGAAAGAVGIVLTYQFGPLAALAVPAVGVYVYWAHRDLRVGLFGLLLAMGVGERYGFGLGFFELSPLKLALALVLSLALVRELAQGRRPDRSLAAIDFSPLEVTAALFGLTLVASSIMAADHVSVLKETIVTVLAILVFALTRRVLGRVQDVRMVLWGVAALGGVIGAQAVVSYAQGVRLSAATDAAGLREGSVLGHPNQLAGLLVVVLPVALALLLSERGAWRRLAAAAATGTVTLALLSTMSRTGWLSAAVGLLVVVLLVRGRVLVWVTVMGVAVALLVSVAGVGGALGDRAGSATDLGQYEVASRLDFWSSSLKILETSPVTGVGLANFAEAYSEVNTQGKWNLPGPGYRPPPHAHNLILTLLAETGMLGATAFMALVIVALGVARKAVRATDPRTRILAAGVIGALAASFVDNSADVTFFNNVTQTTFWIVFGCLAALADILHGRDPVDADRDAPPTGKVAPTVVAPEPAARG